MLNPAPKNVRGWVPKPSLILTLSPQGCDKGRGLYRWPETTNIYMAVVVVPSCTFRLLFHAEVHGSFQEKSFVRLLTVPDFEIEELFEFVSAAAVAIRFLMFQSEIDLFQVPVAKSQKLKVRSLE